MDLSHVTQPNRRWEMTSITTPTPTKSTLRTPKTVKNSLAGQMSSTGNNIYRSKVSNICGVCRQLGLLMSTLARSLFTPKHTPLLPLLPYVKTQTLTLMFIPCSNCQHLFLQWSGIQTLQFIGLTWRNVSHVISCYLRIYFAVIFRIS